MFYSSRTHNTESSRFLSDRNIHSRKNTRFSLCLYLIATYMYKTCANSEIESTFDIKVCIIGQIDNLMAAKEVDSDNVKKQELNDITTCCICTEVYTDPKGLPCIHTFCMKCIQATGLKTNKGPGDEMPCPICRRLFKIPAEGFRGLPKNFFIERLIQVEHLSNQPESSMPLCDACVEENEEAGKEISAADSYCVDCNQKFCLECCRHHRKFKLTKHHRLIPMAEHESGQTVMTNIAPNVCEQHEQKVMDVYCADCKTVICPMCFIDDHSYHKGSHVNKFVDDFRKQIESSANAINECRSKAEIRKADLLKANEVLQDRVATLECDIEKRKEEVKQLVEKHATSLLQNLCLIKQGRMKEIRLETDDINTYISSLETYNSYCQNIMTNGSDSDICCVFSDLSSRAAELQNQCQFTNEIEQSFNFSFRKSEFETFLTGRCDNLIGEIQDQLRYISDPVLIQTIRTKAAKAKQKAIWGLTILDKELFVVSERSSEVEVYDSANFSFSRRWSLEELIDPADIVSCDRNKWLYIMDYKSYRQWKEILRVDSKGKLINKWSTGDICGRLSVTNESNVILTGCDTSKLKEYSPEGQLIHEINLSSDADIRYLRYAIKLTNDLFVVSHGCCNTSGGGDGDDDRQRVCLVDADGQLKKSFGGERGSSIAQLNDPVHLCIDRNVFIMVADRGNSRVILLDSDLKFKREILSKEKHGLLEPSRILLDESNGRLFVVDNKCNSEKVPFVDGRILIFNF